MNAMNPMNPSCESAAPRHCRHTPSPTRRFASLLLAAVASTAAAAPPAAPMAETPAVASAERDGVRYVNGGFGVDEARAVQRQSKDYSLRMMFSAGRDGAYIADVGIDIVDPRGRSVFALADAGPLTAVDLPAGKYTVKATYGAMKSERAVEVAKGKPAQVNFNFPHEARAS